MNPSNRLLRDRQPMLIAFLIVSFLVLFTQYFYAYGQDKSGFPDGFDAVQAAPNSHRVVFENEFVRVLEVTVPPRALPYRCTTTDGQVSFLIGTPAGEHRISVITAPTAA